MENMRRLTYEEPSDVPEPTELKNPYHGVVYIIWCEGFTKIGLTSGDPQSRIDSLQTGNPFPIVLLWAVETDRMQALEKELHTRFERFHVRGEWFRIPDWFLIDLSRELKTKDFRTSFTQIKEITDPPVSPVDHPRTGV